MSVTPRVRAMALMDFPAVVLEAGVDPWGALRAANIDASVLTRPDLTIPADRVAWLLDGVAEQSGLADLAIRLAMRRRMANLGVAGLVLAQQPTVRQAVAAAGKYEHLLSDALKMHIEESDGTAMLIVGVAIGSSAPARQSRELSVAACVHLFRLLLGAAWAPLTVHFSHSPPVGPTLHRRFFGCTVQFASPLDGFEVEPADLDRVNVHADAAMASYAGNLLDALPGPGGNATSLVTRLLHALLPMGRASIDHVARAMARTPRTLQRELAAEGTGFAALLAEARSELAQELLRNSAQPVAVIAERLGYSHPSAFIRAFTSWHGTTPNRWRESNARAWPAR